MNIALRFLRYLRLLSEKQEYLEQDQWINHKFSSPEVPSSIVKYVNPTARFVALFKVFVNYGEFIGDHQVMSPSSLVSICYDKSRYCMLPNRLHS